MEQETKPKYLPQTPENIRAVRFGAGWSQAHVALAVLGIDPREYRNAEDGFRPMAEEYWHEMQDKAKLRLFDYAPKPEPECH